MTPLCRPLSIPDGSVCMNGRLTSLWVRLEACLLLFAERQAGVPVSHSFIARVLSPVLQPAAP